MTGSLRYWRCPDCSELHDKYAWPDNHRRPGEVVCAPAVISDTMPAIQSQVDGRIYDSKAAIRAGYREAGRRDGHEYIEVGNDAARHKPFKRPKADRKAIRDAIEKSIARVDRGDLTERGKRIEITRTGRKAPKHVEPNGPPVPGGVSKPTFH